MAGLCAPLSTLPQDPHGYLRMTRGRCGSLLLHRDGLAPSTPCRAPGALRSTPVNGHSPERRAWLKGATSRNSRLLDYVLYCTTSFGRLVMTHSSSDNLPPHAQLIQMG